MFKCRVCSGTPFAALFGLDDMGDKEDNADKLSAVKDTCESDDGASSPPQPEDVSNSDDEHLDEPRNSEDVEYLAKSWDPYVHERAKQVWKSAKTRSDVLKSIARGCRKKDDPVLGNEIACVKWIGEYKEGYPVLVIAKPGETTEDTTYVSRVMVFLFADEESYEKVDRSNYAPFSMACCNQSCINLTHIKVT